MTLSFSGLNIFKRCPLQFKLTYVDQLDKAERKFKGTEEGSAFHEAMETAFKLAEAEWRRNGRIRWEAIEERVIEQAKEFDRVQKLLSKFYYRELLENAIQHNGKAELKLAVDEKLKPVDFDDPSALFRGIIDLFWIEGDTAHIVDYKTSESRNPDEGQLHFYAMLVKAHYPHVSKFEGYFIIVRDSGVKFEHIAELNPDPEPWLKLVELIKKTADFRPRAGVWCAWCNVAHHCPLADIASTSDPVELAKRYLAVKSAAENLKTLLMELVKQGGPIYLEEGLEVKVATYNRRYVNQEKARKAIANEGVAVEEILEHITITPQLLDALGIDDDSLFYEKEIDRLVVSEGTREEGSEQKAS